ncbi:MAG: hypothetical protein OJJ21_12055 [Ferrovibrio sp.]|uniref:hypothetical protein n=1 Tax=Ferrovibrio sp. TaxID=1917215 RepID=UPI0026339BCE|nr:hypothetical protein [Ferrovibrio sp.]MCW0234323.1 hypothetical protein [Ferrovibrio sp.]
MVYKPRPSRREQRAVLDQARDRLAAGDIDGYWATLEKQDAYAGLARDAAGNRGELGETANARLERFARDRRGRPLTDSERDDIRNAVAAADLAQRDRNLQERGDHRITGQQSVEYHAAVFETRGIPKEAYFPTLLQPDMGGAWGLPANVVLPDIAVPTGLPLTDISDWAQQDWKPVSDRRFRDAVNENAETLPSQGLMETEGFHGNATTETPLQSAQATSFAAQFATLPPTPQRWLDFTLAKAPGDLSESDLHALQAHDAYLKPQHRRHDDAFRLVGDTYRHLYGDAPQEADATGRPLRSPRRQNLPETSAMSAAERRRGEQLASLGARLDRWQQDLGGDAAARHRVTGWLQRGLNDLLWPGAPAPDAVDARRRPYRGGPLLVDGLFGPLTAGALDAAEAGLGLAPLEQGIARIAAVDQGWTADTGPETAPGPVPDIELAPIFFAP